MLQEVTIFEPQTSALAVELEGLADQAKAYAKASKSKSTLRSYRSDWRGFEAWCARVGLEPLPASATTVAGYATALATRGLRPSSICRQVSAIRFAHQGAGHETPTQSSAVKAVLSGIKRTLGTAVKRKAPATAEALAAMLDGLEHEPNRLKAIRDRAILCLGFAGALRRSELVALDVDDLDFAEEGLHVTIRFSKTDQEGEGQVVPIPHGSRLRPVEAVKAWLEAAGIESGAVFRGVNKGGSLASPRLSAYAVAVIVKTRAEAAGLDASIFSGHSLRAGFVTSALEHGADIFRVMDVTRHKEIKTLKCYDRRAKAFKDHAGAAFL